MQASAHCTHSSEERNSHLQIDRVFVEQVLIGELRHDHQWVCVSTFQVNSQPITWTSWTPSTCNNDVTVMIMNSQFYKACFTSIRNHTPRLVRCVGGTPQATSCVTIAFRHFWNRTIDPHRAWAARDAAIVWKRNIVDSKVGCGRAGVGNRQTTAGHINCIIFLARHICF